MPDTFITMYRQLREYVPELPIFLAKKLINDRYRRALDARPWSGLRGEGMLVIPNSYSVGTVTVPQGGTTVTGVGTSWNISMIGMQMKVANQGPIITIADVTDATHLTLSQEYPLSNYGSVASGYTILQNFVTMPADFKYFMVIYDPYRQWRLFFNMTQQDMSLWDPGRTNQGDPWVLADLKFNNAGRAQYELWPGPTSARGYNYYYQKQGADLVNDDDRPIFPFRGSELVRGALADLSVYPGTSTTPNPLFGKMDVMLANDNAYLDQINQIEREDEAMYMNWLQQAGFNAMPYAPLDAKFIQNHAMSYGR